ncbi:MAG: hypothetical protein KGI33_06550 [Thaumarchaeota archaeon]|nr:hypothetical protein [Nitrososphaerota archaeon]
MDNFIKKHGVPRTRVAMRDLVLLADGRAGADGEDVLVMSHVYFQVHPQQVNIRDKSNGRLVVSIRK